jgi:hypothetical protein
VAADQTSRYRVGGLNEEERAQEEERARREVSHLTSGELTEYSRRAERELDILCIKFGATARVVRILDELIQGVTNVAAALSAPHPGYARADLILNRDKLLEAAQQAKINRSDREGKILFGLPKPGDGAAAHDEWLRNVRSVDSNSEWLAAACRYGMARQQALRTVAAEVATALSVIDQPEAQACATRLREVVAKVLSSNVEGH